jgi:hypothetical protein
MEEKKIINNSGIDQSVPEPGWYNELLWWCAGVNRRVLRQCPSEWAKYAGMGGTIFSTACMAALSGGYAISTVFDNTIVAILFGLFWGFVIIFNLDRLIVNTMYSDGEVTISWQEFKSGLPRILLAIFLGIVISTPLEMKIFEDRINSRLVDDNLERTSESRQRGQKGIQDLIDRRNALEKEWKDIESQLTDATDAHTKEITGEGGSGIQGDGTKAKAKEAYKKTIERKRDDWKSAHEIELKGIREQIRIISSKTENRIKKGNEEEGFCVRYEAFSNLTSIKLQFKPEFKLEIPKLFWVSLFITLLFVSIECAPTFMRMMVADGSYEKLLEAESHRFKVLADKRISDLNDEINTEVQISTAKNAQRREAEIQANKDLMERIASVQAELMQTAIDKWREEELAKINKNPSAYIKTNNS